MNIDCIKVSDNNGYVWIFPVLDDQWQYIFMGVLRPEYKLSVLHRQIPGKNYGGLVKHHSLESFTRNTSRSNNPRHNFR